MKKNILANIIGRFWSILSNFLFIPLYIKYLGFESYSVISFTLVITGLMAILDNGLTATLSREFARLDRDKSSKLKTFKTLESTYFLITIFCVVIVFLFSGVVAQNWLNTKSFTSSELSYFIKIVSFDIGFQLLFRFYSGGLLGLEKQMKANLIQIGWGVLRNGLVVIGIILIPTLELFFFWQSLSTILFAIIIKISLEKALLGNYNFDFSFNIDKKVFTDIWKFAGGMMLIALVSALNTQLDKLSISKLLSIESLGYYTLGVALCQSIIVLINPIATAVLPRFTSLYSSAAEKQARFLFNKINLFASILIFNLMSILCIFSKEILWIWTGNEKIAENAYLLVPVIAIAYSMYALQVIPYNVAIANGYTRLNNILGLVSLAVTIPGYFIFTKKYGAIGAAYVFCCVQFLTTIVYIILINKKFIQTNVLKNMFLKQYILPFIISISIACLGSLLFKIENNRLILLIFIGIIAIVSMSVSTLILLPLHDIKKILKFKR